MRYRRDVQVQWRISIYEDNQNDDKHEKFRSNQISKIKIIISLILFVIFLFVINLLLSCQKKNFTFKAYTTPENRSDIGHLNGTTIFHFYSPISSRPLTVYSAMRNLRDNTNFRKTVLHALNKHFSLRGSDFLFIHTNPGTKNNIFELGVTVVYPNENSFRTKIRQMGFAKAPPQENGLFFRDLRKFSRSEYRKIAGFAEGFLTNSFEKFLREGAGYGDDSFLVKVGRYSVSLMNESEEEIFYMRSVISSATVEIGFVDPREKYLFNNAFEWLHEKIEGK